MTKSKSIKFCLLFALVVALFPLLANIVVFGFTGQPEAIINPEESGVMLTNAVWNAAPFLILALVSAIKSAGMKVLPALWTGFAITLAGWSWLAVDGWLCQSNTKECFGANIGIGIVLIFLPIVITVVMMIIMIINNRRRDVTA